MKNDSMGTEVFRASRFGTTFYRYALYSSIALNIAHMISLPVVITYDGYVYVNLADIVGTSRFPSEWDFYRTPLFPLGLKIAFWLFGKQPLAVIAFGTLLGFLGTWLLGAAIKRTGSPLLAGCVVLSATLYPTLIGYEHCLLGEAGTFFFLALIVNLLLWNPQNRLLFLKTGALAVSITMGFYYRQPLLYLAPIIAVLYGASLLTRGSSTGGLRFSSWWRQTWIKVGLHIAVVAILPFVAAYPWNRTDAARRAQAKVLIYGLVKQAAIPPDHPSLGEYKSAYEQEINDFTAEGRLDYGGTGGRHFYQLFFKLLDSSYGSSAPTFFRRIVLENPVRYLKGVGRTLLLFGGLPERGGENKSWRECVLSTSRTGSKLFPGPPHLQQSIEQHFTQKTGISAVSRFLESLVPIYNWLVFFGCILTVPMIVVGFLKRNVKILVFSIIPFSFWLLYALLLLSIDRYAFPTYPIVLVNLCVFPLWLFEPRKTQAPDLLT